MSEYIVKLPTYGAADEFFKTHEMPDMTLYGYPLTGEIVRCMDCENFMNDSEHGAWCNWFMRSLHDDYDGFCAWGERRKS